MFGVNAVGDAHATFSTMSEVFAPTDAAKSAFVAVEWFLLESHPKIAFWAVIFSEGYRTLGINAFVGCSLTGIAFFANNFLDGKPIHRPARRAQFIVAYPATHYQPAAWRDDTALSIVVYA